MRRKEQKLEERMFQLFRENASWGLTKSLAAAIAEDYRRRKARESGKVSVRQIGWLEYT